MKQLPIRLTLLASLLVPVVGCNLIGCRHDTAATPARVAPTTNRAAATDEEQDLRRIVTYLATLTAEEREALEAEALAKANPFFAQQLRRSKGNPEVEARYLKLIVDTHVSGILESH